jgi:hypothetical protein
MGQALRRPAAILLLIALAAFVTVRGVVPALSRIDTDFPNYFTAAKIVVDRGQVERLYDGPWFREQIQRYGMEQQGSFTPFPPPSALLLVPLARLEPLTALRVVTVASLLGLLAAILLLARCLGWSRVDAAVFILLSGNAILGGLRFGQPYILIALLCIIGYYALIRGRPRTAGMCFGLPVPIKYFPVVFLAYLGWRRQWKVLQAGLLVILAIAALSIAILGWQVHETFLRSVLGNHLTANIGVQDPFTVRFQSFDTLFRRLFVFDPERNPHPLWPAPALQVLSLLITKVVLVLAGAAALVRLSRSGAAATAPSMGLIGVLTMLIAPATATYHFALLWLPVALLVDHFFRQGARAGACLILGLYALIGFFPYQFAYPFEGRGGLTVLAYPRLFLLLAMFATCIGYIASPVKAGRAALSSRHEHPASLS